MTHKRRWGLLCLGLILGATTFLPAPMWAAAAPKKNAPPPPAEEDDDPLTEVPERHPGKIAAARALRLTSATLAREIGTITAAIEQALPATAREEALRVAARAQGRSDALANAAAIAWVQQAHESSLFLAALAAKAKPDDDNALNTLGALLAHAGHEHKGIPLLRHLAEKLPNDPTVLSNLGVAWLNIGEVEESRAVLQRCLAVAPGHGTANLAAGVIADAEKKRSEANEHFRRAAASNSSADARRVLRSRRIPHSAPKGFMGMLPKKEYFSLSGYAPRPLQRTLAEYDAKLAERDAYGRALKAAIAKQNVIVQEGAVAGMGGAMRGRSTEPLNPYAKLDWSNHLRRIDPQARLKTAAQRLNTRLAAIRNLRQKYREDANRVPFDPAQNIPKCVFQRPVAQAALAQMNEEYEQLVAETLYVQRDVTNSYMNVLRFTMPNASMYRSAFAAQVAGYLGFIDQLNRELPLLQDPCAGQSTSRPASFELEAPSPGDCPFSLTIKLIIAELNMSCTSIGFDFEAGLAFSARKDFSSGETTLTGGLGAKMDLGDVGKVSGAAQFVVVWGRNNNISFVGVESSTAAKLSGIPGLSGELATDTFDLGREPGSATTGPSVEVSGPDILEDIVKVGSQTRLGVTIGPDSIDPTLSGSIKGAVLGEKLFEMSIPAPKQPGRGK